MHRLNTAGLALAGLAIAGCSRARPTPAPNPAAPPSPGAATPRPDTVQHVNPPARGSAPLPPIPLVEGPLAPRVVYPAARARVESRDSNFIFGSLGNGHATLTINGAPVEVAPNGEWLAFLPVPPSTAPRYDLVAALGADTARLTVPVRPPPPRVELSDTSRAFVDSASVSIGGTGLALRDNELVRVSVRAAPNAMAWVVTNGHRQPLVPVRPTSFATDVLARDLRSGGQVIVGRDADTARFRVPAVAPVDTAQFAVLATTDIGPDTDATVIGRAVPNGTYKWMFLPGTVVEVTGRNSGNVRVRLDSQLEAWIDSVNVRPLALGAPAPRRVIGPITLTPDSEWVDVAMPVSSPPPFLVEEQPDAMTLTLYGTSATPEIIKFLRNDSLVRTVQWTPVASDRIRLTLELSRRPYGYLVLWDQARGLVLRVRRPPRVNASHPLEGLTITVDPGHPPGGGIGPSALTEAEAVLPIAFRLRDLLQERGAKVVMTRTTMDSVDLHLRSVIARQADADALISIHLNAFPDGVNPYVNNGTSTLYFHPQTEPLARLVQSGMEREMGLRDLGVHYQNIAIGRTTWMPALICEGAFLMLPDQENALKTPEFQERYARGVADGVEQYFRTWAR